MPITASHGILSVSAQSSVGVVMATQETDGDKAIQNDTTSYECILRVYTDGGSVTDYKLPAL